MPMPVFVAPLYGHGLQNLSIVEYLEISLHKTFLKEMIQQKKSQKCLSS
jgi:hypothetical protein